MPISIDPRRTALVVVDMQRGCLDELGAMARLGLDITSLKQTVRPVKRLVETCRAAKIPLIFTLYALRPDYVDAGCFAQQFPQAKEIRALSTNTLDVEFLEDLTPTPADYVVEKTRYTAFYNTNLEVLLSGLKVDTLIVCGVTTEMCVESTVRDAFQRDFSVIVVKDAMAAADDARHDGALRTMEYGFATLATTQQVVDALATYSVTG